MNHGLNHFTVTAEDREQTLDCCCGLLGLEPFMHDSNDTKVELDFEAGEAS